jgi:alanyl-tRNA synthetase
MEQHGGEHMLAGALWEKLGGTTIGLHLGQENSSIDVSMPDGRTHLTEDEIILLEDTVNSRIRQDAEIRCWFPSEEKLITLPLRKKPTVSEHIRIVAMGDFEMVACGGTHPRSTGRIGQIKILSASPSKGKVRITFVCGRRAEKLFQIYMRSAHKAGNVLSCPVEKIAGSAGELKARLAEAERKVNRFETERILKEIRKQEERESLRDICLSVTILEEADAKPVSEAVSRYIDEDGLLPKALL